MDGTYLHKNEARALSYLTDALSDLKRAEMLKKKNDVSGALFNSEQCCEKSMKACLAIKGKLMAGIHYGIADFFKSSVIQKMDKKKLRDKFEKLVPKVNELEWYYIPTRYSVSKTGEVFITQFSKEKAKKYYKIAEKCLNLCFDLIEKDLAKKEEKEIKLPKKKDELVAYLKKNYGDVLKIKRG